jgi:hypothetical protein
VVWSAVRLSLAAWLGCASRCASVAAAPLPGLSLSWSDCPGGAAWAADQAFACNVNTGQFTLVCSLAPDSARTSVIGAEAVIDVQSAAATLPDWWRFDGSGPGGCRVGGLSAGLDFSAMTGCTDAWAAQGFGGIQGFSIGPPDHPLPSQARIKAVAAVTSDHAVALATGTQYGVITLILSALNSTGAGTCAGCATRACLVLNSILLRRIPSDGADVFLSAAASAGSNWATWQGTGADCAAVPVQRRTWGQIKSLYR